MSGIVGLWNPDGRQIAREEIASMVAAISHRGPDETRTFIDGPAALGYLHLETRTKPLPVVQPYVDSEARLSIVLDGRLDNREELNTLLDSGGGACRSGSDAELILRVYQLLGVECACRLLGDFVFAIWDSPRQRFFCARDQMGAKPFVYYHARNSLFAFGSEINGIIALDRVPRRLNEFRLADYLVNELDREDTEGTFYLGIQRLPNGHYLIAEQDSLRVIRYWYPPLKEGVRYRSIEEYGEAFRELLMKATADRMRDTARVACALSGGLDSSSVVAAARELVGGRSGAHLPTFSLVDHEGLDALKMIRSVGELGGIESNIIWPEDVTAGNFDLLTFIRDSNEPFEVDQGFFAWITYKAAHRLGFRTLFDGLDGDQMHPYALCLSSLIRRGHWLAAIRDARYLTVDWDLSARRILIQYGLSPAFPRTVRSLAWVKLALRKPQTRQSIELIDEDFALRTCITDRCKSRRQTIANASHDPFLLHSLSFITGWTSFALEGNESMAGLLGMELRHPLADKRLAEFLISLPLERKVHFPASKSIMRSAMGGLLPEALLSQRRLPHPGPAYLKRLLELHREWFESALKRALCSLRGYVNLQAISHLEQEYRSNRGSGAGLALWNLAVLSEWMDQKGAGGSHVR